MSDAQATPQPDKYTVLLYSDDSAVRDKIRMAIGVRPAADLAVEFVDAHDWEECRRLLDTYVIDLMVLDGEAAPAGGLGIARQTKDEYATPPPVCVVIARAADRWLAAYAQVDRTLLYPLDPVTTGQTIAGMLRDHRNGAIPLGTMGTLG
jgi:DNA-binding response OmpR family regulator